MLSKLVSKMKGICERKVTEVEIGWMVIALACLLAGASAYALIQAGGELTTPILGGFLFSIFILTVSLFRSRFKELEDKVEKLSKKDDGIQ